MDETAKRRRMLVVVASRRARQSSDQSDVHTGGATGGSSGFILWRDSAAFEHSHAACSCLLNDDCREVCHSDGLPMIT